MSPLERMEEHFSNIQFSGRCEAIVRQASARFVVALCRRQTAALFWIANQVFGARRGALPPDELQRVAGAAARGEDWETLRDQMAEDREEARRRRARQLPPGR